MKRLWKAILSTVVSCCLMGGLALFTACGESAYDIAVKNGFEGTEQEWLQSLQGANGKDGVDGKDGKDGVNGKDGADGQDGVDGKDGKDGVNGKDGANGKDGINGRDGADGADGQDGADGKDGTNGADGKDGTAFYTGDKAPEKTMGNAGDLYLNETNMDLYKKGTNGEWTLVGNLKGSGQNGTDGKDGVNGKDGKDGVDGKDGADGAAGKDGKSAYDSYVEQYIAEHGSAEGVLTEEEWVKSFSAYTTWKTGTAYPAQAPEKVGEFYFDSKNNKLYQATESEEGLVWSLVLDVGKQTIDHIWHYDGSGGLTYYYPEISGHEGTEGYFIYYKDGTYEFIGVDCRHEYNSDIPGNKKTIVYDNCENGEVSAIKCIHCGQWALSFREPSIASPHKYDTATWVTDKDSHWHEATCSHAAQLDPIDKGGHQWIQLSDTVSICSVCKYIFVDTSIKTEADGTLVIKSVTDWQTFANGVNNDETYEYGEGQTKKYSEATVKLDADLDFTGQLFIPAGLPSNAQDVFEITSNNFAELKNKENPEIVGGFKGTFDGQDKSIRGIKYNALNFAGLFGYLDGGKVHDLTIKESEIIGDYAVGAVAGFMTGDEAKISNVNVIDCKVTGLVYVGGVVGYAYNAGAAVTKKQAISTAAIENCVVKGTKYEGTWNLSNSYLPAMQICALGGYTDESGKYYNGYYGAGIAGISYGSTIYGCTVETAVISVGHTLRKALIANAVGTETRYAVTYGCKVGDKEGNNVLFQTKLGQKSKDGKTIFNWTDVVIELDYETFGVESGKAHYDGVNGSTSKWWTTFHDDYCYSAGHSILQKD